MLFQSSGGLNTARGEERLAGCPKVVASQGFPFVKKWVATDRPPVRTGIAYHMRQSFTERDPVARGSFASRRGIEHVRFWDMSEP